MNHQDHQDPQKVVGGQLMRFFDSPEFKFRIDRTLGLARLVNKGKLELDIEKEQGFQNSILIEFESC